MREPKYHRGEDLLVRFERCYTPEPNTGCWLWIGPYAANYGVLYRAGKNIKAHRFSYESYRGPIPAGLVIDHICNQTWCVNPDHLRAVTNWENVRRGRAFSAMNSRKTLCKRGHPLSGDNLILYPDGRRWCQTCAQLSDERKTLRRRDAAAMKEAMRALENA